MSQSSAGSDYANTDSAYQVGEADDDSSSEHGVSGKLCHLVGCDVLVDFHVAELVYHNDGDD